MNIVYDMDNGRYKGVMIPVMAPDMFTDQVLYLGLVGDNPEGLTVELKRGDAVLLSVEVNLMDIVNAAIIFTRQHIFSYADLLRGEIQRHG